MRLVVYGMPAIGPPNGRETHPLHRRCQCYLYTTVPCNGSVLRVLPWCVGYRTTGFLTGKPLCFIQISCSLAAYPATLLEGLGRFQRPLSCCWTKGQSGLVCRDLHRAARGVNRGRICSLGLGHSHSPRPGLGYRGSFRPFGGDGRHFGRSSWAAMEP